MYEFVEMWTRGFSLAFVFCFLFFLREESSGSLLMWVEEIDCQFDFVLAVQLMSVSISDDEGVRRG